MPPPTPNPNEFLTVFFWFTSSDAIVSQVLDELGLTLSDELSSEKLYFFTWTAFLSHCQLFSTSHFNWCRLQIFRAPEEACRQRRGRRPRPRLPWPTQTPIWRSDWTTSGETESSNLLPEDAAAEAVNKKTCSSLCDWVPFKGIPGTTLAVPSSVLRPCGFLLAAFSFTELIMFNQKVPAYKGFSILQD